MRKLAITALAALALAGSIEAASPAGFRGGFGGFHGGGMRAGGFRGGFGGGGGFRRFGGGGAFIGGALLGGALGYGISQCYVPQFDVYGNLLGYAWDC
jgi:hypothetical protein